MGLDSIRGHSVDMGRNGEGTKEGPFPEQSDYSGGISEYQKKVNMLSELWDGVCKCDPSQKLVKERMFDGQLGAAIRALNSKGLVVDRDKLIRDINSASLINNVLNDPDFDIEDANIR